MPGWVTSGRLESPGDVAFMSGAALAHLHVVLAEGAIPHALLRERLALQVAEACVVVSGRPERAAGLRDAVAFLQPGDAAGPAGEVWQCWRRAVERPVSAQSLKRAVPGLAPEQAAIWLEAGQGVPVERAALVLEAALAERPRAVEVALIFADAALARALGWAHLVPLLGVGLKPVEVRLTGEDLRMACHRAVVRASGEAGRLAAELARRAVHLAEVAPKLRAKGAGAAVALFLARDAVAPMALRSLRSDRAARRFCDRLVELGAVRELTGRETFRLYGL